MDEDLENGYIHAIQTLKGERNAQNEKLARFLQTALDALRADDPFIACAIERIEDCLKIVK